jgi:hypothetical protein
MFRNPRERPLILTSREIPVRETLTRSVTEPYVTEQGLVVGRRNPERIWTTHLWGHVANI